MQQLAAFHRTEPELVVVASPHDQAHVSIDCLEHNPLREVFVAWAVFARCEVTCAYFVFGALIVERGALQLNGMGDRAVEARCFAHCAQFTEGFFECMHALKVIIESFDLGLAVRQQRRDRGAGLCDFSVPLFRSRRVAVCARMPCSSSENVLSKGAARSAACTGLSWRRPRRLRFQIDRPPLSAAARLDDLPLA